MNRFANPKDSMSLPRSSLRLIQWFSVFLFGMACVRAQEPILRNVRITADPAVAGQVFEVAVELVALGDENSAGFSLTFDPTRMTFEGLLPATSGRRLIANTNRVAQGRVGIAVAEPPGRTFGAGVHRLVSVRMRAAVAVGPAGLGYADDPVLRETAAVTASPLTTVYTGLDLQIEPLVLPAIATHPIDTTAPAGTNVSLGVTATGSPPLRIRWERDEVILPGREGGILTFHPLRTEDAGTYRAIVSNGGGSVTSAPARVTVLPALIPVVIRTQPESFRASAGETVRFEVQAAGSAPLTFRWLRNDTEIPDATNSLLTIASAGTEHAGRYRAVVGNPISSVSSAEVELTVSSTLRTLRLADREIPAGTIIEVPVELDAFGDENAVGFSLAFDPLHLEFLSAERPVAAGQMILNVQAAAAGLGKVGIAIARPPGQNFGVGAVTVARLRFRVGGIPGSLEVGLVGDPVTVEIADVKGRIRPVEVRSGRWTILDTAPSIIVPPAGTVVRLFDPVRLEVDALGSEPMHFRWFRNGQPVDGATNRFLAFVASGPGLAGSYHVVVSNAVQSVTSVPAMVDLRRVVRIGGTNVPTGTTLSLPVEALLAGTENAIGFGLRFDPTLVNLISVQPGGSVANASWIVRTNGPVAGVAGIALALPAGQRLPAGTQTVAVLTFEAGQNAGTSGIRFTDAPISREVADADARIVATDFLDGQVMAFRMAPSIVRHPVPRETTVGDPVVFAVQAEGSLPLQYEWRLNGNPVMGATNRIYSIPSVQTAQAGNYSVRLVNPVGEGVSSNALLTVNIPDFTGPVLGDFTYDLAPLVPGATLVRSGTFRLAASDPSGVARVEFLLDGEHLHSDLDGTDGFASPVDLERFADGDRILQVRAFDSRSNPTQTNLPVRIALAVPNAIQLTAPANGTVTSNRMIRVAGNAPLRTHVRVHRNGSPAGADAAVSPLGTFDALIPLADGTNDLTAAAVNRAGEGPRTPPVRVIVDSSLPPAPGGLRGMARAGGRVRIEWVAAADAVKGYVLYRSGQPFELRNAAVRITPSPIPATAFEEIPPGEGTWHYRVAQVNQAGVEGLLSTPVVVASDATPPTARIEYRIAGTTNPVSGPVGPGLISVVVEVSEPTDGNPFLSLSVAGAAPLSVELTPASPTLYRGTLALDGVLWEGAARATFSARDKAGNRGDQVTAGQSLQVDTVPPRIVALSINPSAPIRNPSAAPAVVEFIATLSEPPGNGIQPTFTLQLSRSNPSSIAPLGLTPGPDARTWSVTFRLPAEAGQEPELATLAFDAVDALGNRGTEIVPTHEFEVFGDELPALAPPAGLVGRALSGGRIALVWQGVTGAAGYRVFRRSGINAFEMVASEVGTNSWVDLPPADGRYEFAVASVRRAADRMTVGQVSDPVAVDSDRTPPIRPEGFSVVLARNGVFARWSQPPGVTDLAGFALYRSTSPIPADGAGLVPLISGIPGIQVVDPAPHPDQPYYAVAAIDRAGNASVPSDAGYLNILLVPPQEVVVGVTNADPPVLTWNQVGLGIAGHDVFLGDETSNIPLNRRGLVTGNRFVDVGYNGGERLYTVFAVDQNGQRSAGRSVPLPVARVALKPESLLRRGLMNRLVYEVTLDADEPVERASWVVQLGGRVHRSEEFTLPSRTPVEVPVVVGGYEDLAGASTTWIGTLELETAPGVLTRRTSAGTVPLSDGQLLIDVLAGDLVRGSTAHPRFRLLNPGTEPIEVITATGQGTGASSDIRISLFDAEGRVLAMVPYRSVLGPNHVLLANGDTVVRLGPGEELVLPEVALPIPANVPRRVWIQTEIDRVLYASDSEQRVELRGVKSASAFEVLATSYTGIVSAVSPERSRGDGPITLQGRAWFRTDRQPAPRQPLLVKVAHAGFDRTEQVVTDDAGQFTTTFAPLEGEAGGVYSVWAVHPDLTDRSVQAQFVIERLIPDTRSFTVRTPYGFRQPLGFGVAAGPGTVVTNVRVELRAEDQPGGTIPNGITLEPGPGLARLDSEQPGRIGFHLTGTAAAPRSSRLMLRLASDGPSDTPWAMLAVECEFSEAFPLLRWTPALVETGVTPGSNILEQVRLENVGVIAATNVFFSLHRADGAPLPAWAALATQPNLPELAVGGRALVGLTFRPPASQLDGNHRFVLRVRSANHPQMDLPVDVSVLTAGRGQALVRVEDMYTGTPGHDGVAGARVRLRNQAVNQVEHTLATDPSGEAFFEDLPAGLYDYQVTSDTHVAANGRLWVRSGSTTSQKVMLTYSLISVEWEVVPITIEDRYEIVLTAVFETEVPGAVITVSPTAINLPQMFVGDVLQGELIVENHGLIAADNVQVQLPGSDGTVQYEILGGVPERVAAGQRVRVPYRVTCVSSFPGPRTTPPTANGTLSQARGSGTSAASRLDDLPAHVRRVARTATEGSGCFTHSQPLSVLFDYLCANQERLTGSAGSRFWYSYVGGDCGGPPVTGGGVAVGGPSGPGGGVTVSAPFTPLAGLPQCCPPENCEPQGECDTKCCEQENATCGSSPPGPPTPDIPPPRGQHGPPPGPSPQRGAALASESGSPVGTFRFSNRLLCAPNGETYLESDRRQLVFERDARGLSTIRVGPVPYTPLDTARTLFGYRANRLRVVDGGYRWENTDGMWEQYDADGRLQQTGRRNRLQTVRRYDDQGRLSEVHDARGNVLVRYTRDEGSRVTVIEDRHGRRTEYGYNGGLLAMARDIEGLVTRYEYGTDPGCGGRAVVSRVLLPGGAVRNYGYRSSSCEGPIFLSRLVDDAGNGQDEEHRYDPDSRTYYLKIAGTGGEIREKRFDSRGNLIEETVNGHVQRRILRAGRIDVITDAGGHDTVREHDEFGQVVREIAPDGGITLRDYHPVHHLPTRIQGPRGAVTLMTYDAQGNLTQRIDAAGTPIARTNAWVYDTANRMTRHTDGRGTRTDYEYDPRGFLRREFNPDDPAHQTRYEHDDRGNRIALIDALDHVTRYGYDAMDRLVAETNALNHVSLYTYDRGLLIEMETGRNQGQPGRVVRYRYDEQRRRTQTVRVDDAGQEHVWETHTYDGEGRMVATANALGQVTRHEYNSLGQRVKLSRPFSATETSDIQYEYDEEGHLVREIDPLGIVTEYEHDPMGRQQKVTEAVGTEVQRSRTRGYDLTGNLISIAYSDGTNTLTTFYDYDLLDRRIAISGAREYPKQFEYDVNNNLVAEINGRGYRTEHRYDAYNRRTNSVEGIKLPSEPGESTGYYLYNPVNQVTLAVDGNGNHQQFHHDALGRVIAQSVRLMSNEGFLPNGWWRDPQLTLKSVGLNPWGQTVETTDWAGATAAILYDSFGRPFQKISASGLKVTHSYSGLDRVIFTIEEANEAGCAECYTRNTSYGYNDANGKYLSKIIEQNGSGIILVRNRAFKEVERHEGFRIQRKKLDPLGREYLRADATGRIIQSKFDALDSITRSEKIVAKSGKVVEVVDTKFDSYGKPVMQVLADGSATRFLYDQVGNRIELVDANGNSTRWEYDARNRAVTKIYADSSAVKYQYDPSGNVIGRVDANGQLKRVEYSSANKPTQVTYANGDRISMDYDPHARLIKMADRNGVSTWGYDSLGRVRFNEQGGSGFRIEYEYDAHGNYKEVSVRSMLNEDRRTTQYAYGNIGQMLRITAKGPRTMTYMYEWDSVNRLPRNIIYPDGQTLERSFDDAGRATKLSLISEFGTTIDTSEVGYDYGAIIIREKNGDVISEYERDSLGQLSEMSEISEEGAIVSKRQFISDSVGNRRRVNLDGEVHEYSLNELNQVTEIRSRTNPRHIQHDSNGNLVDDGHHKYHYDGENRLSRIDRADEWVRFVYDGLGRMVLIEEGGTNRPSTSRRLAYDGWLPVAYETPTNLVSYIRGLDLGGGREGSGGIGGLLGIMENLQHRDLVVDVRGNTWLNRTDSKPDWESVRVDIFGVPDVDSSESAVPTISQKESITGWGVVNFGGRFYRPDMGRWLTRDPRGEVDARSLYAFCSNDPASRIDPFGFVCKEIGPLQFSFGPLDIASELVPMWFGFEGSVSGKFCARQCVKSEDCPLKVPANLRPSSSAEFVFPAGLDLSAGLEGDNFDAGLRFEVRASVPEESLLDDLWNMNLSVSPQGHAEAEFQKWFKSIDLIVAKYSCVCASVQLEMEGDIEMGLYPTRLAAYAVSAEVLWALQAALAEAGAAWSAWGGAFANGARSAALGF